MKNIKTTNGANISKEVADSVNFLDILSYIIDEGYFNSDGTPKYDLQTVNKFLSREKGYDNYFETEEEMSLFLGKIKKTLLKLTNKIK